MNITLEAKDLLKISTIANSLKPRITLPQTKYVQVIARNEEMVLRYSNLEQLIDLKIKLQDTNEGDCYLPIKRTMQLMQYEKGKVELKSTDKGVIISSKSDKNGSLNAVFYIDKFEDLKPPDNQGIEFDLPKDFQKRMAYTLKCVATELSRPILTGVLFDFDGKDLNLISADGFWLVHVKTELNSLTQPFKLIIPQEAIKLVTRFMTGQIKMGYNADRVWFKSEDMTIISQLVQGTYPAWQQLIPQSEPTWTINVSAPIFNQRLNQFAKSTNYKHIIRMQPKEGMLSLSESEEELEKTEVIIPATFKGEGKIAFNKRYLLEASKLYSIMNIETTTLSAPIKVSGDLEGVGFVIMPIFAQW